MANSPLMNALLLGAQAPDAEQAYEDSPALRRVTGGRKARKNQPRRIARPGAADYARTLGSMALAVPRASQTASELGMQIGEALPGALRNFSVKDVLPAAARGLRGAYEYATEDPANAFADFSVVGAGRDFMKDVRRAAELRAAGRGAEAAGIEKMALPFLAMGALGGSKGRGAVRAGEEIAADALRAGEHRIRPAEIAMDPRIETRVGEMPKVSSMEIALANRNAREPKPLSVFDLEGKPFITSMSDLSAAGDDIVGVNNVALKEPVRRRGGQDYMFNNPGSVWASDLGVAGRHLDLARKLKAETGQNPVFMPWAMGPTAIDFAHMPRELMLQYAASNMNKREGQKLAKDVRGIVPEFREASDPASMEAFREAAGAQRAALNRLLDTYRDKGGLGIGAARLATTDLNQIGAPLTSLRNVGVIEPGAGLAPSTHQSYRTSIPGEGLGRLKEQVGALDLLPDLMAATNTSHPFKFPVGVVPGQKSPLRALQMAPKGGVITEDILRAIERRLAEEAGNP